MSRLLAVTALVAALAPASAPRPRILGISHVGLKVSNVAASRAFYEEFLGLKDLRVNARQHIELVPGLAPDEDRLDTSRWRPMTRRDCAGFSPPEA